MNKIFNYTDYRKYLKDLFKNKKREASYYSLRNISNRIGIRSSGYLSMIINGQRNLSDQNAKKLAQVIKLSQKEQDYFYTLIQFNQAKNHSEKQEFYKKLKRVADPAALIKKEQHIFYEEWYYSAIRELVSIYNVYDTNINEMAEKINPKISISDFKKGLKILIKTNLIQKNAKGKYVRNNTLISSGTELKSFTVHKFQKETMNLASEALDRFDKEERELSTITMSIDKKAYNKIKERSAEFRKEIMEIAANTNNPTRVLQLNLQIFPLSNDKGDNNE